MPSFRQKSTSSEFHKNYTVGPIFACGSWEYLGRTRGPTMPHTTWWRGRQVAAPGHGVGPTWTFTSSPTYHFFLLPDQRHFHPKNSCSCCSFSWISIALLSPSLLLRFGAFVLWYVTPPFIQMEFCLVDYILSILLL